MNDPDNSSSLQIRGDSLVQTFFWHDYETWGADPRRDRPAQFAGIRTDLDFNPIGEPLMIYARPAEDVLPHPQACLITGISPQQAVREGLPETDFIRVILEEMAVPGTCSVGYNSVRFDDEVTRNTLYRNLRDPYEREWRNGNSRWDLIDVMRLAYALRPEGLEWPLSEDGVPSFRLEELTAANGIAHEGAHDALVDVRATIALAKRLKAAQPRLFDYAFHHRSKNSLKPLIDISGSKPLLHVSSKYPARNGCCALVVPLAMHPTNPNGVIVADLREDPDRWTNLSADTIREKLYTRAEDLAEGETRIPLKTVHLNKCPVLVESKILKTVDPERLAQFGLEGDILRQHLKKIRFVQGLASKVTEVFTSEWGDHDADPDLMLYGGDFFDDHDRRQLSAVLSMPPTDLAGWQGNFHDARLEEMVFRYRARNYPDLLLEEEVGRWEQFRQKRLMQGADGFLDFKTFAQDLQQAAESVADDPRKLALLEELQVYAESIYPFG